MTGNEGRGEESSRVRRRYRVGVAPGLAARSPSVRSRWSPGTVEPRAHFLRSRSDEGKPGCCQMVYWGRRSRKALVVRGSATVRALAVLRLSGRSGLSGGPLVHPEGRRACASVWARQRAQVRIAVGRLFEVFMQAGQLRGSRSEQAPQARRESSRAA